MGTTRKERAALEQVLYHPARAEKYLVQPRVAGIAVETAHPNGANYVIVAPVCSPVQAVNVMSKYVGSDIVGIVDAKTALHNFLFPTAPAATN